jgi:hypothetical protein
MIYEWLVFLHVLSVLLFVAGHGAAIGVSFRIRSAAGREAVIGMLDASRATQGLTYTAMGLLVATGIALGIMGDWWRSIWFWAALLILVGITGAMVPLGAIPFSRLRQYVGVPYAIQGKWFPAEPPDDARLAAQQATIRPDLLLLIGLGGLAIVLYLMMFKPF